MRSTIDVIHREITRIKVFSMIEDVIWTAMREDLVNIMTRFDIIEFFGEEVKLMLEPRNEDIMKNEP
jgi:hypothetical protein